MPEHGPGSVARFARRFVALCIDYGLALIVAGLVGPYDSTRNTAATLVIFVITQVVFIGTIGGSIGHRLLGMRLLTIDGAQLSWGKVIVRTLLLAVVIPALVWDSDQRGFHDKVAGTVLVRFPNAAAAGRA